MVAVLRKVALYPQASLDKCRLPPGIYPLSMTLLRLVRCVPCHKAGAADRKNSRSGRGAARFCSTMKAKLWPWDARIKPNSGLFPRVMTKPAWASGARSLYAVDPIGGLRPRCWGIRAKTCAHGLRFGWGSASGSDFGARADVRSGADLAGSTREPQPT